MKKEGMVVSDYYDTSKTYEVFFRRNNRSTSPEVKLRLFYAQDTDIKLGTVFVLKDIPYVVVSQDGVESDVYYTSMAIKCDTYFTVYSNTAKGYMKIPFVTMTDKYTVSSGSVMTVISGSVVIYTGLNDHVKDMAVNNAYYNYGGYYKVGNYFYNNDIAYVYLTREAMPNEDDTYVLTFSGETSVDGEVYIDMVSNSTYQLSYNALHNSTIVDNPTLTYVSSNTDVATVNDNGMIRFIGAGETTITATWVENNVTCATVVNVSNGSTEPIKVATLSTLTNRIKIGGSYKTITFNVYEDSTDITTDTINGLERTDFVWTCSIDGEDFTNNSMVVWYDGTNDTVNKKKIKITDDAETYVTKTMVITCTCEKLGLSASMDLEITYIF